MDGPASLRKIASKERPGKYHLQQCIHARVPRGCKIRIYSYWKQALMIYRDAELEVRFANRCEFRLPIPVVPIPATTWKAGCDDSNDRKSKSPRAEQILPAEIQMASIEFSDEARRPCGRRKIPRVPRKGVLRFAHAM